MTLWLVRCLVLVPSVQSSAGRLRCLLDSLVIPVFAILHHNTLIWWGLLSVAQNVHCPFFVVVETVPVRTVNRQCSSGLQAVADVAAAIKAGYYDIGTIWIYMLVLLLCFSLAAESLLSLQTGIGAGLESMSINSMGWEGQVNPRVRIMNHTVNWNWFFF